MVYSDYTGRPTRRRPIKRRTPSVNSECTVDASTRFIRQVAAEHPEFTPDEVYAVVRNDPYSQDITKDMVWAVLND